MNGRHKMQLSTPQSHSRILQQLVRLCCLRKSLLICIVVALIRGEVRVQSESDRGVQLSDLVLRHTYPQTRAASYDRTGGNNDFVKIVPGETIILLDDSGPAIITHLSITTASLKAYHLKKLVLRMFWDDQVSPSVETPVDGFFGLGLGDYFQFESVPLSVAPDKALNYFFLTPFRKPARITATNQGSGNADTFYLNIDYQALRKDLAADTMYFDAQYRQAMPAKGWTSHWESNDMPAVIAKRNLDGEDNYVWLGASGQSHFVG
jgi:hypothetical protein